MNIIGLPKTQAGLILRRVKTGHRPYRETTMNNKWCQQLAKKVNENPAIEKLKVSDETFSVNYQEDFAVGDALYDLEVLALISNDNPVQARLVTIAREGKNYSIKLYTLKDSIPLSQSMPIIESMNLQALIGRPYKIRLAGKLFWIHYFTDRKSVV